MKIGISETIRVFGVLLKAGWQLSRGVHCVSRLRQPIVSIFGGRWGEQKYSEKAHMLAGTFVENGFSVISGGGPGIMAEANCGAYEKGKMLNIQKMVTLGIGVTGVDKDFVNPCAQMTKSDYFFVRKWLLTRYSHGIVILPGGIGTVDELFDILNLIKLGKLQPRPIVLYDSAYWDPLIAWYKQSVDQGLIQEEFESLFYVTNDLDEAVSLIVHAIKR